MFGPYTSTSYRGSHYNVAALLIKQLFKCSLCMSGVKMIIIGWTLLQRKEERISTRAAGKLDSKKVIDSVIK